MSKTMFYGGSPEPEELYDSIKEHEALEKMNDFLQNITGYEYDALVKLIPITRIMDRLKDELQEKAYMERRINELHGQFCNKIPEK